MAVILWLLTALATCITASAYDLTSADTRLLDELQRAGVEFFWDNADSVTGLVKDRSRAEGPDERPVASIAATGFGLTALCIAHERRLKPRAEIEARVVRTLEFISGKLPNERGFFYHFVNARNGERAWKCELSTIDTAILLCGVLTCASYFAHEEIQRLGTNIYLRVEWPWLLRTNHCLSHGWKPETGFLKSTWDEYSEHMMLYLLAIGSSSHPIASSTWHAWRRPEMEYVGMRYISPKAPLFVHQYSHAWFDFRGQHDQYCDYFENSVRATKAHRAFCMTLTNRFPEFGAELWGITASDSIRGYTAWGGPPELGRLDGTMVPCAPAGSLPFLPRETLRTLHAFRSRYGTKVWKRYGFVDSFNPHTDWYNPDVIGIDVGITVVMAENLRTGFVWKQFMKNPQVRDAMTKVGFRR